MRSPWTRLRRWFPSPRRYTVRPRLEQLESRLAPTVNLLNHFDGMNVNSGGGEAPPDTCGAVGPNSYVETVNAAVTIYNKSTNAVIASDSLSDFLYNQGGIHSNGGLFDATMCYDSVTGQYIIGDMDIAWPVTGGSAGALDIAVSKNSNPTTLNTSNWNFYQINMTEANEDADYPGNFGFNKDAFVFTFNMFDANDNGGHVEVAAISQSSLAAGGSLTINRFNENGFSWRPVVMHDSTAGGPMWFVTEHGDNRSIDLERVNNILTSPSTTTYNIPVNSYNSINAPLNPDGSEITTDIDTRIMNAAERNNEIVSCQHVGVNGNEDDARWYEFNVSNVNSPTLAQQGNVGFGANTYTVYPSIDINANGDIGMGFTKSGNDTSADYMSTYVTGQAAGDPAGTMETPVKVRAGDSINYDGREGDFSGLNVDSDGSFWAADEYALSSSWGTEVAQFTLSSQSFPVVNGQLQILGDQLGSNYNDSATVEVNQNGGVTAILNGQTASFGAGQITSIYIALGGGTNTVNLLSTPSGVTTDIVGGGTDTVNVGNGTTQNILADVNIENPTVSSTVIVDDSSDTGARTVTLGNLGTNPADSEGNSDPWGQISGLLGSGNINYEYNDTNGLTIDTGTAANTINVQATGGSGVTTIQGKANNTINVGNGTVSGITGTLKLNGPAGSIALLVNDSTDTANLTTTVATTFMTGLTPAAIDFASASLASLTLDGGGGNNTWDINGTSANAPLTVNSGNGANSFFITSSNESLSGIQGSVTLNGGSGANTLTVDDQNDANNDTYTIAAGSIARSSAATITYSSIGGVTVNGSSTAAITYTLTSTVAATPLTLTGGSGANVFNLTPVSENLNDLAGAVTIDAGSASTVNLDDQSNSAVSTYTITATNVTRSGFGGLTYAGLGNLKLNGGSVADTYDISGTASGSSVTVTGGLGNDTFNVGDSSNTLNGIQGKLTINGGKGTNTLNVFDQGSSSGQTYTLSKTTLTRSGAANIVVSALAHFNITASNGGNDALTILSPVPTLTTSFTGGSGTNTLTGANVNNTWTIKSNNGGTLGKVTFSNFQNLIGGNKVDTFKFTSATASKVVSINGGGAPTHQGDWLDYSSFGTSAVTVNLATGSASNVNGGAAGGITGIQNAIGSSKGVNNLTGDAQGNILIGGSNATGNTLTGGSGNSLLIGGSGGGSITGGSGEDILIAGTTTYSATTATGKNALMAILAELQSSDTFAQQVSDIINGNATGGGSDLNGKSKLTWGVTGATVKASTGNFQLYGDTTAATTADWFFANSSSTVNDFNDDGVNDEHNNNTIGTF